MRHDVGGNVAGTFRVTPLGVILHGTRSGQPGTIQQEFDRTLNYIRVGAGGLGWNITVAEDQIGIHMEPDQWGWNARSASGLYLAAEWAQATLDAPISEAQVATFCWWYAKVARVRWPELPLFFPNHSDLPQGAADGKTDLERAGKHTVRDRILARLAWEYGIKP